MWDPQTDQGSCILFYSVDILQDTIYQGSCILYTVQVYSRILYTRVHVSSIQYRYTPGYYIPGLMYSLYCIDILDDTIYQGSCILYTVQIYSRILYTRVHVFSIQYRYTPGYYIPGFMYSLYSIGILQDFINKGSCILYKVQIYCRILYTRVRVSSIQYRYTPGYYIPGFMYPL